MKVDQGKRELRIPPKHYGPSEFPKAIVTTQQGKINNKKDSPIQPARGQCVVRRVYPVLFRAHARERKPTPAGEKKQAGPEPE